jgi:hypothetical protein
MWLKLAKNYHHITHQHDVYDLVPILAANKIIDVLLLLTEKFKYVFQKDHQSLL